MSNSAFNQNTTNITKADVGLGNVDNTSNAAERVATATLTNKDLSSTTNTFPAGSQVQFVDTLSSASATGTSIIPRDDTIPQNTEGTEFMTVTITPRFTSSKLVVEACAFISHSAGNTSLTSALFQDSTANAIAASNAFQAIGTGNLQTTIYHSFTAGSLSATTFKIRCGGSQAGTLTFNGGAGGAPRLYGAITKSWIKVTEIKA